MLRRTIHALSPVAAVVTLSACGSAAGHGAASPTVSGATNHAGDAKRAAVIVRQAFAANPKANSGHVSGTIDISVKGAPRYRLPISLTTVGRFSDSPGAALSNWDELLGLGVRGLVYGAGMTSSNGNAYLNIGSTAFVVPAETVALMRGAASGARNGLIKTLAAFGLRPDLWVRNPRIVGDEQIDRTDTVHVISGIDAARVFFDAGRFTQLLTSLRVTSLTDLPEAIGPAAQAALARSVTAARGDIWTGASDHVIRKARMTMSLAVAPGDRPALSGITSATVDVNLDVTEVGAPQQISVQRDQQSWARAAPLLDAVAFGNRPAGQRGN